MDGTGLDRAGQRSTVRFHRCGSIGFDARSVSRITLADIPHYGGDSWWLGYSPFDSNLDLLEKVVQAPPGRRASRSGGSWQFCGFHFFRGYLHGLSSQFPLMGYYTYDYDLFLFNGF